MDADAIEAVLSRRFRLGAAPTLVAPISAGMPIAFTDLQCPRAGHGWSGPVPGDNAFAFQVVLQPIWSWTRRTCRSQVPLPASGPGDVFLFDLSEDPRLDLSSPFDMVRLYIPQSALDALAQERGLRRVGGLTAPATGLRDPVLHGLALSLCAGLLRPRESPPLFVESVALAFHAHVVHAYAGAPEPGNRHAGLAPWQMRRLRDAMEGELAAKHSISGLADACGLSSSHFVRAFKDTTGMPPHRWLTGRRIARARHLLLRSGMELADIALACGFVDQSHFSRVFTRAEHQTPGQWRRQHLS